jgi:phenylpropionate dioxygenase-like ring-hydroxylating dioxygenase large terminal subunit
LIEATLWHPVAGSDALAGAPLPVRLLAQDLVLWRDDTGRACVFTDRCPPRGTRLSLGRVVQHGGRASLECPYHG